MTGSVEIHAVIRFRVETSGQNDEEMILNALSAASLPPGSEIAKYEVTEYNAEGNDVYLYHDRDFLDSLHEERLEEALVFDFSAAVDDLSNATQET